MSLSAAQAAETPSAGRLDARVTSVVYQPNNVVRVFATYGISTMIIFDEDEKFETIAVGDSDSWDVVPTDKGNILFVKPKARNAATNMNVVTTKRIYYLELTDFAPEDNKKVFGIRFVYPDKDLNASLRKEAEARAAFPNIAGIDKANVNIDYSFSGDPGLKPLMIFDDGKKTFFKFGPKVPAIFAVNADFTETLRNFRREGDYIVLDGTATQYTLRDGNQWTCIFNLRKPDFGAPDPAVMGPAFDSTASKRRRTGNG
ncbi:TrbG/VirB9 family P-type conjugative transfer protein [Neorhizobium sp. Rsf11]|uniref:TrbG/VirB9 family P-type conjugative transfer protein n=2 Tax=Neorhizobium TaxID=1525371 RepID=A0ABV0MC12_9HYPH|nr:TrbG/VirB9 family P-type conjugative transfer protein [Neorhizobium petrolearium]MCC2614442.1 TrbG/VirB9 family P-type conjugative transfer protein [Neorhizobium petrolearium]WGI72549.1 TrbG/VirB9 family P-type conjugative transfer protein [Neorhizobium petrolearium]